MSRAAFAAVAVAIAACAPRVQGPAPEDGIVIERRTRTYRIDMSSPAAMTASILEARRHADLSTTLGQTNTVVRWSFTTQPGGAGCLASNVVVSAKSTISIPRWSVPSDASAERREWWKKIQNSVRAHEERHASIAEEGARAIRESLLGLRDEKCALLRARAESIGNDEMDRVRARQREFDRSEGPLIIPPRPK